MRTHIHYVGEASAGRADGLAGGAGDAALELLAGDERSRAEQAEEDGGECEEHVEYKRTGSRWLSWVQEQAMSTPTS
jgi:hypothetical protein